MEKAAVRVRASSSRRVRIGDVAREAGVSKTAVSFAFNSPDRLNTDTVTRIRDVASALGYRPDPVARMLTQRRTNAIGILTPQILSVTFSNPFFGALIEGMALAAEGAGYRLDFISPVHGSLARGLGRATVDGVIAVGLAADHPEVVSARRAGLPLVLVDSSGTPGLASVDVDDEGGARAAAGHIAALGHRRILVTAIEPQEWRASDEPNAVVARRMKGYRAALDEAGIELAQESVLVGPATIDGGFTAFTRAWENGLRPTAVIAMSDVMAIGAMSAARTLGLVVPGDISVVGFDDIEVSRYLDPPLTTVHQPIRQKGSEAVRLLFAAMVNGDGGQGEHRRLDTRLVIRASTGPAPSRRKEVAGKTN